MSRINRQYSRRLSFLVTVASCLVVLPCLRPRLAKAENLVGYVNALQGTNSRFELTYGNTYPAVALPWGTHTWTPQTGRNGDGWKYQYHKSTIRGFQQAHQCSSWSNDYNVFSLMPIVGQLVVDERQRAAEFSHDDEIAKPDYYRVALENGIVVEMSPTAHGALLRMQFPDSGAAHLVLDGYTRFAAVKISEQDRRINGRVRNGRNLSRGFFNHFVMEFDQPLQAHGVWKSSDDGAEVTPAAAEIEGHRVGAYLSFPPGTTLNLRVASSYVDLEQAQRNLRQQLPASLQLENIRQRANSEWNEVLSKVQVEGGTEEQKRTFYSCMYRACLFPRKFFEYDENNAPIYRSPYDGEVHTGRMYTDTGLWDTFRAQMPLNALLHPRMHGRYMQALLDAYEQCGWLPSWSFPGEAGSMIGNHAISLLADAWVKGIRTFDPNVAVQAYLHESTAKGPWGPANGRGGWQDYQRLGYLPSPQYREASSKTLEYAYDDFCGYQLATAIGDIERADLFSRHMYNYRNLYDPDSGFIRGKDADGNWNANFRPNEWGGPFTEGCAWHWLWSTFHDVEGLIELVGGKERFCERLDEVFTTSSDFEVGTYGAPIHEMREMVLANMGQYAHGNQPIQHMVYLYNYAGQPWKSQYWSRQVMDRLYNSTENGYPGDEDQGQTSSWYVLSALGFYSVCPGTDEYVLGSPLFEKATIALENGKTFQIVAERTAEDQIYIQEAQLNGQPYEKNYLRHQDVISGGVLKLKMAATPNRERGTRAEDVPFSVSTQPSTGLQTNTTVD